MRIRAQLATKRAAIYNQLAQSMMADNVIIPVVNPNLFLAARNLANVLVVEPRYADPLSLVFYKKVLVTKGAMEKLQEMLA